MRPGSRAALLALGLWLASGSIQPAAAASAVEIDAAAETALTRFFEEVPAGRELAAKAEAMPVFPRVVRRGSGSAAKYRAGALRAAGGRTLGYYSTVAASIGLQTGAQARSEIILFMTEDALRQFLQTSDGFEVGVDGSIALIQVRVAGEISTASALDEPVIALISDERGLMASLSLEGTKITKLDK